MLNIDCPTPHIDQSVIGLQCGGGGRLMRNFLRQEIEKRFPDVQSNRDAAELAQNLKPGQRLAFTTDSYVVDPLIFPGGDIGKLAVCGTMNDLSCSGATALGLSLSLIIEEGLSLKTLQIILDSIKSESESAGVKVVTGDTKVVDRGHGHGLYINTAAIGVIPENINWSTDQVNQGDLLILSGDLGRHAIAIKSAREQLAFEHPVHSDVACISGYLKKLKEESVNVRCVRDLTRGGLASTLHEWAEATGFSMILTESAIPQNIDVRATCELLGLDALNLACEGRFLMAVAADDAQRALQILREFSSHSCPNIVGSIASKGMVPVSIENTYGVKRAITWPLADPLPRIC